MSLAVCAIAVDAYRTSAAPIRPMNAYLMTVRLQRQSADDLRSRGSLSLRGSRRRAERARRPPPDAAGGPPILVDPLAVERKRAQLDANITECRPEHREVCMQTPPRLV
jgi:hypothetical protein